jgi:glycyl-tRNA synthetase
MASTVNKTAHPFDKGRLEALLSRRFFYAPAFEIYGGALRSLDRDHPLTEQNALQASLGYTTTAPRAPPSKPT